MEVITLRNPHSVLAVFRHRPSAVCEIRVSTTALPSGPWQEVLDIAKRQNCRITQVLPVGGRTKEDKFERQSGLSAIVESREPSDVRDLFADVESSPNGVWLGLDCLQDPHNLGAIFRTAAFFGVKGVIVTRDRSAPLTGTAYDVAAGGLEAVPFSQPVNLRQALQIAKEKGVWVLGSSEHADKPIESIPHDRPWLLLVGNEEQGLRRLTLEECDEVCRISAHGSVGSLNVSVASGVLLHALTRVSV